MDERVYYSFFEKKNEVHKMILYRSSHQRCSVRKVFFEISRNSHENSCARVSFLIKLEASGLQLYWESIWKFNERVGWTEDTLDCCRKILQPPNVVKLMSLYNSWYLIYLNNKNNKVQITDFEFINNVFIVSDISSFS